MAALNRPWRVAPERARWVKFRAFSASMYFVGMVAAWSGMTGHVPGGIVLLAVALCLNAVREQVFALEVRGI